MSVGLLPTEAPHGDLELAGFLAVIEDDEERIAVPDTRAIPGIVLRIDYLLEDDLCIWGVGFQPDFFNVTEDHLAVDEFIMTLPIIDGPTILMDPATVSPCRLTTGDCNLETLEPASSLIAFLAT